MIPVRVDTRAKDAAARLTSAFKNKRVLGAVVKALAAEWQELEGAIWDVINGRLLDNAGTDQLDKLGRLVGERRAGRANDDYRLAIRVRIRVNRSDGRAEDIIAVARLIATNTYREAYPAGFVVAFTAAIPAGARWAAQAIAQTRAGGVAGQVTLFTDPVKPVFRFSATGSTTASSSRGFGSHIAPHTGCQMRGAIES